jgi:hypothetical protein
MVLALFGGAVQAAVLHLDDALDVTDSAYLEGGGFTKDFATTISIGGEESLFVQGTMRFDVVDSTEAKGYVRLEVGGQYDFEYEAGHAWNTDDFKYLYPDPDVMLDDVLTDGESHTFVWKISQSGAHAGDWWYFLDPDLSKPEDQNTPSASGTGGNTGALTRILISQLGDDQIDCLDFAVYTDGDTPFQETSSAVPEPLSALSVLLGVGVLGTYSRRRLRRALPPRV